VLSCLDAYLTALPPAVGGELVDVPQDVPGGAGQTDVGQECHLLCLGVALVTTTAASSRTSPPGVVRHAGAIHAGAMDIPAASAPAPGNTDHVPTTEPDHGPHSSETRLAARVVSHLAAFSRWAAPAAATCEEGGDKGRGEQNGVRALWIAALCRTVYAMSLSRPVYRGLALPC
jgi:hypothetical protein